MYINTRPSALRCGNCTYGVPMGAIYIDPTIKPAPRSTLQECVECYYACYTGPPSLGALESVRFVTHDTPRSFMMLRLRFDPERMCARTCRV
jgi:hypothetical protein